jgi:hypothetical protein
MLMLPRSHPKMRRKRILLLTTKLSLLRSIPSTSLSQLTAPKSRRTFHLRP